MIVSGPSIEESTATCTRNKHPDCPELHAFIEGPEQAAALVDSLQAAGADMIKIHNVPRPIWFAVAREARRVGIPFGGHFNLTQDSLPGTIDGLVASDSGPRILDHFLWAQTCGFRDARETPDTMLSLEQCAAAAARLRRNDTWIVTEGPNVFGLLPDTMVGHALQVFVQPIMEPSLPTPRPRPLLAGTELMSIVPDSLRRRPECRRALLAFEADLPWAPGPDFPLGPLLGPHAAMLAQGICGVPPWWALRAATLNPVRALHLTDSLGTVAAGKIADVVLLEGDPLLDIANVTRVKAVVANGRYFDRAALDRLEAEANVGWRAWREKTMPAPSGKQP